MKGGRGGLRKGGLRKGTWSTKPSPSTFDLRSPPATLEPRRVGLKTGEKPKEQKREDLTTARDSFEKDHWQVSDTQVWFEKAQERFKNAQLLVDLQKSKAATERNVTRRRRIVYTSSWSPSGRTWTP